jgi:hypothetical protein
MAGREQVSVALLEHDSNDDVLCVWNYPGSCIMTYPFRDLLIHSLFCRRIISNSVFVHREVQSR